ncbi:GTPase [Cellulomonas sp. HZM]|uniref:GTPase n=1 Tax=Cellulomonas sp. HZM TaxID=1454010 RepID=UPI00054F9223|nr:GTPase [Cellulomonas sp. HZM]
MTDDDALRSRVDALVGAVDAAGDRVEPAVAERVRTTAAGVRERLALGVDHTIVALVGGTGSGKSSLFNALSRLQFADVGVRRPTTSQVTACVWGPGAGALLDWLGVAEDRRIQRESALDGEAETELRGLVLLDLPDHDSIEPEHRAVVDRLLPQADALVWVVDPQKYADDALHTGYLQRLVGHEASMLVMLNQLDTVPVPERTSLLTDVSDLLVADGLSGVPVWGVSALTGEGVGDVRAAFASAVAARSLAATRASAELDDAVRALGPTVAEREPAALTVSSVVDTLADAAGLPAVASAVGAASRGRDTTVPDVGPLQAHTVGRARAAWLDPIASALPARWSADLRDRAATAARLGEESAHALASLRVEVQRSRAAVSLTVLAVVLGVAAIALGAVGVGSLTGAGATATWAFVGAAVAVAGVVACVLGAAAARRSAGRRRARQTLQDGRAVLEDVARRLLLEPTQAVLAEHRAVREQMERARG